MHGFGVSKEQQMIQELAFVLSKRNYGHEVNDIKIMISHRGEPIEVTAVDGTYVIKCGHGSGIVRKKTTKRKTLQSAVNVITATLNEAVEMRNHFKKQYLAGNETFLAMHENKWFTKKEMMSLYEQKSREERQMRKSTFAQKQVEKEIEIEKTLTVLKAVTHEQFTLLGLDIHYKAYTEDYNLMMEQFNKSKKLLLQPDDNNKELISRYLASTNELIRQGNRIFTLAQVVLVLIGIQTQKAYDTEDEIAYQQLLQDVVIWQDIIQRADTIVKGCCE
ncbi:hypothetical protein [Bacillus thuringiensis]|uniref:hypothetical protein n=1 Tax=Bacillus thuringiensis TaxID=1428 RepID=UPI000BF69C89|nr:hypothetical protein [Bacillus thuringiensis]PEY76279.1 hypothetical protein CN355_02850 [Bacillus thuringiensis]